MKPLSKDKKWEKCEKIGKILKCQKEIIFNNYDYFRPYFRGIEKRIPEAINHVNKVIEEILNETSI